MRASIPAVAAIVFAIALVRPLNASEAPPAAAALPAAIGEGVVAVVRVDDTRWLMGQLDAALGGNGAVASIARSGLAELLFGCRSMASIDDTRPSLIAWRGGDAPLVAMIPFRDRDRFLQDFGGLQLVDRLLVRTGEREGTVVYNQVTPQGTWEYRLILRNGYACLARTKAECELLADAGLEIDVDAPPLRVEWRGGFLAEALAIDADALVGDIGGEAQAMAGPLAEAVRSSWRGLLDQISLLQLHLAPGEQGDVRVHLACDARADSALATWISRQSNAGSRLLPLVVRPGDLLSGHGSLRWQGELERLGRSLGRELADTLGREVFTEQMDADMRGYFALLDRQGPFAFGVGIAADEKRISGVQRVVSEQPNAADLITLERGLDALFVDEGDELGEFDSVSGLLSYRKVLAQEGAPDLVTLSAAGRDHLLKVSAEDPQVALVELRTLIASLGETHVPQGAAGVFALRIHLDTVLDVATRYLMKPTVAFEPMAIDLACRVAGGRRLTLDLDLPLARLHEEVSRAGLMPDPAERSGSSRKRR